MLSGWRGWAAAALALLWLAGPGAAPGADGARAAAGAGAVGVGGTAGVAGPEAAAAQGPGASPGEGRPRLVIELSESARAAVQPPTVTVTGGLTARYGDLVVRADQLEYDDGQGLAVFSGRVRLERPGQAMEGSRVLYDLRSGRAEASGALVAVRADGVRGPVYLEAPRVVAEPGRVEAAGAELTTCPLPVHGAHYRVRVSRLEVEPGRWVRAYDAVLLDSGIPLFYWPYLSFSLSNPRAGRFAPPQVGYGAREGWFVRTQVPYMGPGELYGYVNVDYYEKLGPGLGLYQALYDDGARWVAAYLHAISASAGRPTPDFAAGVEGEAAAGGGRVSAAASFTETADPGRLRQQGRLSARAEAPAWGLAGAAAGLLQHEPGQAPAAVASEGRLRLEPPSAGALRLAVSGRWNVNTLPEADPRRVLWDAEASLKWAPSPTLVVGLGGSRLSHPDLYADPSRIVDPARVTEWLSVERLPELSAEYRAVRGSLGPVPAALVVGASAARIAEERPVRGDPGGLAGTGETAVRADRLTAEARLEAGPARLGPVETRASTGLWAAWYTGGERQAAARTGLLAAYRPDPGLELTAEYTSERPVALPGTAGGETGAGSGGGGADSAGPSGSSPFRFDRVQRQDALTLGAAVGREAPVGAAAVARYRLQVGRWELDDVTVRAHAGRGSGLSAALTGLYRPPDGRWEWVVGSVELQSGSLAAALAGRLRPQTGRWDRLAARVAWRLQDRVILAAGAELRPDLPSPGPGRLPWAERADVELAVRVAGDWVISAAGSYNRQVGGWVRTEIGLALDQDCRAVALRYDPERRQVALAYQIKVFPEALVALAAAPSPPLHDPGQWGLLLASLREGS